MRNSSLIFAITWLLTGINPATGNDPQTKPINQRTASSNSSPAEDGDVRIGPDYIPGTELAWKNGVPRGKLHDFFTDSKDSKVYPGIQGHYFRMGRLYVPAQYVPGTPAPFMVVPGGDVLIVPLLDNLIAKHELPIMIAIFIGSGGGDQQESQKKLEYDNVSDRYVQFIETELLPKLAMDYNLKFTTDPDGRATMGVGSAGAAAFTMAWFRPDLYRRVLVYSGAFVNRQLGIVFATPHGAWEYHEHFILNTPPRPLRIWMEVGEYDEGYTESEETLNNFVLANNRMAAALKAKGYHYRYVFAARAEYREPKVIGQTLPQAMRWLWRGYPVK